LTGRNEVYYSRANARSEYLLTCRKNLLGKTGFVGGVKTRKISYRNGGIAGKLGSFGSDTGVTLFVVVHFGISGG